MAIMQNRIDTKASREGFLQKEWRGQLISNAILVGSNATFGRGVIDLGGGLVQVPDRENVLGNGATSDEAANFLGVIKAFQINREPYELDGSVPMPTLATPVGRDDVNFANEGTAQGIVEIGYVGEISEEAVSEGDPVTLRVAGEDDATGKVLGGFGKTAVADEALVLDGVFWGADSDALGENFLLIRIKGIL